jgi:haloalkane dehalogenase
MDAALESGFHVMAPDLPGFGKSGKWNDPSDYSFQTHVDAIEYLVQKQDPDSLVVVGHDWGGPVGLETAFTFRERVSGIVLINTGTFFDLRLPLFFRLMMKPGIGELLFGRLNGFVELGLRAGCSQRQKLRPQVMMHYRRPFRTSEDRAGVVAFPRMIPTDASHENWKRFERLEQQASDLNVPVAIISGQQDPVFGPSYGQRMEKLFPRGVHRVIKNGSHYLQEDQPERLAKLLQGFLERVV